MTYSAVKSFFLGFLLLTTGRMLAVYGQSQPPPFALSMTVSCQGYADQTLEFLTRDGALVGMDPYDEAGAIAPGPVDPDGNPIGGLLSAIHPATSELGDEYKFTDARPLAYKVSWTFSIQIPANKTGKLNWSTYELHDGWKVTLTGAAELDMRGVQTLSLTAAGTHTFTLAAEMIGIPVPKSGEFRQIRPGWNLLSPVLRSTRSSDDVAIDAVMRTGNAPYRVYGLTDGALQLTSEYVIGRAYWVYHPGATIVDAWPVTVCEYEGREWPREPGWNFIGVKDEESLAEETAWTWDPAAGKGGFRVINNSAETLAIGVGYWVYKPAAR
ncbi:MAG TPA: hypothetical protein PKY10_09685 [Lentisphaeria bacterium]|nr:hypothetical protein [Lentisphaeria bacterium]